jgi:hypothetical protein
MLVVPNTDDANTDDATTSMCLQLQRLLKRHQEPGAENQEPAGAGLVQPKRQITHADSLATRQQF